MKKILLPFLLFIILTAQGQSVLINEFVSNNETTLQDTDGEYSDWVELYNPTNSSINLLNYSLSDDDADLNKWTFPEVIILPKEYLLIFASGKNRLDSVELHTNFKISAGGEKLYLTNPLGTNIDQTISVVLADDESYCRIPDGSMNWAIIKAPTPNGSNNNSTLLSFSHPQGFYETPIALKISSTQSDTIFYTLNGDLPTHNSTLLKDSILIDNRSSEPNTISTIPTTPSQSIIGFRAWEAPSEKVHKATTLRCASFKNGLRTSEIYSKTYFVDDEIMDKYSVPVISLITDKENLFNADSGLFVPGVNLDSTKTDLTGNYYMRGEEWERNIHIEYFEKNGNLGFSQNAGVRVHGGVTRRVPQKSMRLYARNEYGEQYFNHKLLPQKPVNQYKRFILNTTETYWFGHTIIEESVAKEITDNLNLDQPDNQPTVVYVNGEYWGLYTLRDRVDERYIEYTHQIDHDSVDFKGASNAAYNELKDFVDNNSLEINANYEFVKTLIDIDNFIDYTISEFFFANYDWPGNNYKVWHKAPDGKWRWVFYDVGAGYGAQSQNYNMFEHATGNDSTVNWPNSPSTTFLFRNLFKNQLFQNQLIDRYAELLKTNFTFETTSTILDSIKEVYKPEIINQSARWHYPSSYSKWEKDIEVYLRSFLQKRPCGVRENIMEFFELTNFDFECDLNSDTIKNLNNSAQLIIAPNPSNGKIFLYNRNSDLLNASLSITNLQGQLVVKEGNINLIQNKKTFFNFSGLSNGTYLLKVTTGNYSEQKKMIIIQ